MSFLETPAPPIEGVAIIGMAGRFPGAGSVAQFWRNQLDGIEAISHFRVEDLEVPDAMALSRNPNYVRARSVVDDVDLFDADFFGMYPREAELTDPQQRLFLQCCWQAFEDAGYDPSSYPGSVGVYAGNSPSTYFLSRLCSQPGFIQKFTGSYQVGNYLEMLGNNPDFLSTRVSYKLNLRGPSFTMQAGCSTSLLAVTQACQSLLTYQSDMALAGGASITFPQKRGSFYQDGGMISPDGHCRTFDADAQGTVFGSGVAVVLLKRLEDAWSDGDQVYAVIRGFAANNDGFSKVGYTAPSVEGQARVIALAQEAAGVDPESIGYIEAHGTGTPLGDPIELAALTQAFRARTDRKQFCVIGTAKTNVGHLDVAAGVTGLIHAAHVVRHGMFPPTLHFKKPNPTFELENSPFYVNTKRAEWPPVKTPRRAGVSAFGVGGTNAHVLLEQAPSPSVEPSSRPVELLVISARSEAALERATDNLAEHFRTHPDIQMANAAWTLQAGRRAFPCRRTVTARDLPEAVAALSLRDRKRVQTRLRPNENPEVCFLFPGQGSQHLNMGREIYDTERVFRDAVDRCSEVLRPHLGVDIRTLLYPQEGVSEEARRKVTETITAQPAIFTIEYALAQVWMSWGVQPKAMLGHSIGEFVAACLAGVFSLEDALALVAARGRMMEDLPPGGMLSVRLPEAEASKLLNGHLSLAAVNSPSLCVVAGPFEALEKFEKQLCSEGVACRRLVTSHAFHSAMMDPIIEPFRARVAQVLLCPPQIPYISGVTGTWITARDSTDPAYWSRHFRRPVLFSAGISELRNSASRILLEVGPGDVLSTLARQHCGVSADQLIVSSLSEGFSGDGDVACLMSALGSLWLAGAQPNWAAVQGGQRRQRISLPTYPFEYKRYWLEGLAVEDAGDAVRTVPVTALQPVATAITINEEPVHNIIQTPAAESDAASRVTRISRLLLETFEELSGMDLSKVDGATTFLEMGFDSLFLTQVTQSLQSKFGLKVTFRQLLGDESSLDALAQYVESKLPTGVLAATSPPIAPNVPSASLAAPATSVPVRMASPVLVAGNGDPAMSETPVERLMREQLQAMNQLFGRQLEVISGLAAVPGAPAPSAAIAAPRGPAASNIPTALVPTATVAAPALPEASDRDGFRPFGPYKPPQRGGSGEISERQRKALDDLIECSAKRTAKSKSMTQQYRKPLADPRVVSGFRPEWKEMVYPIVTVRSQGARLWDVDGNEYIDLVNGFGPIMLGHRPEFVEKAIERQLRDGFETGPQTPLAGEIAQMFCEMTGNERMTFCNTGSEAVTAALRVARTVTGRNRIVLFTGAYHGMFDEVLVKGFKNRAGLLHSAPVAPGIPREKVANVTVLDYGTQESLEWIRQNAKDLAAVLVEPVQSRHPHLQPVEFLRETRKITHDSDTALIFDEVVTGFRVHPGGCQALFGIRADLATYGKVVAGGMPIGILAGKAAYMDALDGGQWQFGDNSYPEVGVTFFAGTFVRHPLALAAAKAVLQHLKGQGPGLQERLNQRTTELVCTLNEFLEQNSVPTRIESFGSIFSFSFPTEERWASLFYCYMRAKGIHIRDGFPCFLTTAHTDADIAQITEAFKESVIEMQKGGFFPEPLAAEQAAAAPVRPATPLAPEVAREAPVTEPQLEVWLSDQLGAEASCSYNESFTLHMRGSVNESALRDALQQLVQRHDALRASFSAEGNVQRFRPQLDLEIPTIDLTHLVPAEREGRLQQIITDDAHTPFRLSEGPLVRAQLVKMESQYTLLIFTSHHIVCDGWSTNVLLDELSKIYNALNRHVGWDLSEPMSFAAYSKLQKEFLDGPEGANIENYWLEQFRQPAPLLNLPTDRPRPSVKEFKGATYRRRINAASYNSIKKLGAKQKCTLFVTLLSGFQILLSRLSGQDDIVIGIPTAGQSLLDDAVLVGHCVNFIPLRVHAGGTLTAAEFLTHTKRIVLDGYDHQNYTYGRLVRKLALQRDPSRLPLTEVQFNLERVGDDVHFDGFQSEVDPNPKSFVNFDIFLNIVESKDGLVMDCDYNTGLFQEETIARWLGHYEVLLAAMVADVNQPISRLPLLSETDRKQALVDWNATSAEYPRNSCVHQLFATQVRATPDRIAVVFEGEGLTYAQLDRRANQLARHLRKLGVKPGVHAGVFVERSLEMIVGLLGVLKAGGAYVPMDPTYPLERISFVLADASVPVLLTQQRLVQSWAAAGTRLVCLDSDWDDIARESDDALDLAITAEHLAYVIYTSGSTGKPKGVEIPHRAVVNLLTSMRKNPGLEGADTLFAVTTLSFDIAALELFLPLCSGAKLVIASREAAADGSQLLAGLRSSGATVMQATPVTWKLLLEAGWDGNPRLKVLCGGEACPRELANELVKRASSVWNMYGPTETTIWSATARVQTGEGAVLIGPPIDNTQFYVIDPNGQLSPIGVPGELYIGGDGLARGYFHRPELSNERFIPNPFSPDLNGRLYRTGDLVRRLPCGTMEFLGRLDHQVKLRGFRIELGEIETALVRYPGVRDAVVIVREDNPGDKRLVAYVTSDQQAITVTSVREFLTGKLPNYMLPSAVVRTDALPRTPNGKIDRNALPQSEGDGVARSKEHTAPRTDQEKLLAGIWAEVLHLERVGVHDNLFELGADSLHIFQIAARAGKAGISIAPAQFLKYRTIASLLAQQQNANSGAGGQAVTTRIVPVAREKYRVKQLII